MDDKTIVELYLDRDERAILETDRKYGAFCRAVALNLLSVKEDAEECVSEAYHRAWLAVPESRPERFKPWLGKIVRNVALNMIERDQATKRSGDRFKALIDEIDECVPSPETVEGAAEDREIAECINGWLRSLPRADRTLFVRRYWYGESVADLAKERGVPAQRVTQKLLRLRRALRRALEKEGISP